MDMALARLMPISACTKQKGRGGVSGDIIIGIQKWSGLFFLQESIGAEQYIIHMF